MNKQYVINNEYKKKSGSAIINQTMAKKLNLKNPLGSLISDNVGQQWEIIGVIEDFNFESFKTSISPLLMVLGESNEVMAIKVKTSNLQTTLSKIEKKWDEFSPNQSMRYNFIDQEFELMYSDVKRMGSFILNFTFLAILIACLGLFALAQFTVKKRIKEIGIRKVNGAKISEILTILNIDFIKWVAIAFIIAAPLAWYVMQKWLENFVYKSTLSWWIFALAGMSTLALALITVSWQSWKAATRNPVEALRHK